MKKVLLILVGLIALGCSKSEDKNEPQKTNKEQHSEQEQKQKADEQNKKEAMIYFALAKTSLNNSLNKNKEYDFWTNTLKALEVSKGNEEVYREVDDFIKNNRFATPRWLDSQQSEINNLINKLNEYNSIINKYSNIKGAIDLFNQWKN